MIVNERMIFSLDNVFRTAKLEADVFFFTKVLQVSVMFSCHSVSILGMSVFL